MRAPGRLAANVGVMEDFELPGERENLIQALRHRARTEFGLRGPIFFLAATVLAAKQQPEMDFRVAALLNSLGQNSDRNVLLAFRDMAHGNDSIEG